MIRICTRCNEQKPSDEEHITDRWCRTCRKQANRNSYQRKKKMAAEGVRRYCARCKKLRPSEENHIIDSRCRDCRRFYNGAIRIHRGTHLSFDETVEWMRKNKSDRNENGCLLFKGRSDRYPMINFKKKPYLLHRVVSGAGPEEVAHHICGNRSCWEKTHIELVSHPENVSEGSRVRLLRDQIIQLGHEPCV